MTSATGRSGFVSSAGSAFTFIELVLVMTTIAILGLIAMPRLSATFTTLEAEQGAQEIAQLLRVAHAQAVAGAHTVQCRYEPDERQVVIQPVGGNATTERRSHPLPAGAHVDILAPDPAAGLVFYPNGTSSGATIVLSLGAHVYHLAIDPITSLVTLQPGRPAAG